MGNAVLKTGMTILIAVMTFGMGCTSEDGLSVGGNVDSIVIHPIMMDGWENHIIWCNWTKDTNASAFKPPVGEHWYAGAKLSSQHEPNPRMFDSEITVKCTDDRGRAVFGVRVVITDLGVNDEGTTDLRGEVRLSLRGCHLGVNDVQEDIWVKAKETMATITVLAGDTTPDLGTMA